MLKNIKIATKVFTGFGIILALLLGLAVTAAVALNDSGNYFGEYREAARLRNALNRVGYALQRVRVNVRNFMLDPSEAAAKQTLDRLSLMTKEIDESQKLAGESRKDLVAQVDRLEGWSKDWRDTFEALVDKQNKRNEVVRNTLDKVGPEVETSLGSMMKNAASIGNADAAYKMAELGTNLLRARMLMQRFLRTRETKTADEIRKELAEMGEDIARLMPELKIDENKALLGKIDGMRKTYLAGAEETFKVIGERDELFNKKMKVLGDDMVKASDELTSTLRQFQDELGPRAEAAIATAITVALIIGGLALVVGIIAAWFIGMGIARPIVAMTTAMRELAGRNMTVEIPAADHRDEVGEMASAVQVFKDNMIKADQLQAEQAREQEARNRRVAAVDDLTKTFDSTATAVLNTVSSAATELESTAGSMSATAEETSKQATAVAAAAEQAATNVQTVASAAEELSSSISEISRQVNKSSEIAARAVKEAEATHAQVQGLAEAANKIGEVVSLITDIAEQTNLLALNATIEAARAGEAGKGFAVVASEVKNLANQTAKATDEISAQITGIQQETREAVEAIDGIGKTITEINEIATAIASAVEEQGAATQEIARNVEQAATGTTEVTSNISGVNQAASETGAASGQVLEASRELAEQANQLRGIVQKFLADVRAA